MKHIDIRYSRRGGSLAARICVTIAAAAALLSCGTAPARNAGDHTISSAVVLGTGVPGNEASTVVKLEVPQGAYLMRVSAAIDGNACPLMGYDTHAYAEAGWTNATYHGYFTAPDGRNFVWVSFRNWKHDWERQCAVTITIRYDPESLRGENIAPVKESYLSEKPYDIVIEGPFRYIKPARNMIIKRVHKAGFEGSVAGIEVSHNSRDAAAYEFWSAGSLKLLEAQTHETSSGTETEKIYYYDPVRNTWYEIPV